MKDRCSYDCIDRLMFPKKLDNRPGLSRIDYRIGTYADILEFLHRKLDKCDALDGWKHREADDPGIALLEGAAILGDILTFYQQLYANEAYLRTAEWRESIADLVRLVGYRLSPGLGGKATFAFEVKGDKPVVIPAGFPLKAQLQKAEKSVDFETTQEHVALPSFSKFQLYKPLRPSTIPKTTGTNEFNIIRPSQSEGRIHLEPGDRLLIGKPVPYYGETKRISDPEVVVVDSIQEIHGRQIFTIKGMGVMNRATNTDLVIGFKLGRTFKHFGHNAPPKYIKIATHNQIREKKLNFSRFFSDDTKSNRRLRDMYGVIGVRVVNPVIRKKDIPLQGAIGDLSLGGTLIVQCKLWKDNLTTDSVQNPKEFGNVTFISTINNINSQSMTWGAMSGESTVVSIDQELTIDKREGRSTIYYGTTDIRSIQCHEVVSPILVIYATEKETSDEAGDELCYYGKKLESRLISGRKLLFEYPSGDTFTRRVVSAIGAVWDNVSGSKIRKYNLILDKSVSYSGFSNENPSITVYGNLVEATQGKTEKDAILGNGDNRETFQAFKLPKAPLTYFVGEDATPPEVPELEIYVNGHRWNRVSSFFGHGPKDEIYIVREDSDQKSWVQFGDGKTGTRLPSGIGNVVARYRSGTGAYGPAKEGASPQPGEALKGLRKVYMPALATGGSEPEGAGKAREAAPGKVQSLGRLVSLQDFETEALGIPGVEKVSAKWREKGNTYPVPSILLTLLMVCGREKEFEKLREVLSKYNSERGPNRFPVSPVQGFRKFVYLTLNIIFDPSAYDQESIRRSIKEALGVTGEEQNGIDGSKGLFGVQHRCFGQREYANRIEGIVQNVAGVIRAGVACWGFLAGGSDDPLELSKEAPTENSYLEAGDHALLCLYTAHLELVPESLETMRGRHE